MLYQVFTETKKSKRFKFGIRAVPTKRKGGSLLDMGKISAYWLGTINTLYGVNVEKNLAENLLRAKEYKHITNTIPKSLRTSINYNKEMMALTKGVSKRLFGVGLVLSVVDVYQDPSMNNFAWNIGDNVVGLVAFLPGMQIPALIYFTARIGYDIYDAYNKP